MLINLAQNPLISRRRFPIRSCYRSPRLIRENPLPRSQFVPRRRFPKPRSFVLSREVPLWGRIYHAVSLVARYAAISAGVAVKPLPRRPRRLALPAESPFVTCSPQSRAAWPCGAPWSLKYRARAREGPRRVRVAPLRTRRCPAGRVEVQAEDDFIAGRYQPVSWRSSAVGSPPQRDLCNRVPHADGAAGCGLDRWLGDVADRPNWVARKRLVRQRRRFLPP